MQQRTEKDVRVVMINTCVPFSEEKQETHHLATLVHLSIQRK